MILFRILAERFAVEIVQQDKLSSYVAEIKSLNPDKQICFLVEGINDFLAKEVSCEKPRANKQIIEQALLWIQMGKKINYL